MKIWSKAFEEGERIPSKYTCKGQDISPPLSFSDVPEKTKSLALILVDPDAPSGKFVHWVVYNIHPDITDLEENIQKTEKLKNGIYQGNNDFGRVGYGGPCPPYGTHRYYFKLYALDTILDFRPGVRETELLKVIFHHNIAEAHFKGIFSKESQKL
jgi:Raf kinase inhibitor-like YbhB/YbcL family protein